MLNIFNLFRENAFASNSYVPDSNAPGKPWQIPNGMKYLFQSHHHPVNCSQDIQDLLAPLNKILPLKVNSAQDLFVHKLSTVFDAQYIRGNQWRKHMFDLIDFYNFHAKQIKFTKEIAPLMNLVIQAALLSYAKNFSAIRPTFLRNLNRAGFFKNYWDLTFETLKLLINMQDSSLFKQFLSYKQVIPNDKLLPVARIFHIATRDNAFRFDLFHKLNPEDYENKKWRHLTSYEKLYWLVNEPMDALYLSHRLGLKGSIKPHWHGSRLKELNLEPKPSEKKLELEGIDQDLALIQLKKSLLLFQASNHQVSSKIQPVLEATIQKLCAITPKFEHRFRHKLSDRDNHIYIFSLDEHATTAYHTLDGRLYLINMGFQCGAYPGIRIFQVPRDKRPNIHSQLCSLQYDHKTSHFKKLPKKNHLPKEGYIELPLQISGNCCYESLRGLFAAILFDNLLQKYSHLEAYHLSMSIYRAFCEFDIHDAIYDYSMHALSPSLKLLELAYDHKQISLNKLVYDNLSFSFDSPSIEEGPVTHRYTSKRISKP